MELFGTISPNGGSVSATKVDSPLAQFGVPYEPHTYINAPHAATSFDTRLWNDPETFNPER